MYVCMYVSVYAHMYVRTYICVYVYTYSRIFYGNRPALILLLLTLSFLFSLYIPYVRLGTKVTQSL
jgi:hypothetical protein